MEEPLSEKLGGPENRANGEGGKERQFSGPDATRVSGVGMRITQLFSVLGA